MKKSILALTLLSLSIVSYSSDIFEKREYEHGVDSLIGATTLLVGFLLSPITGEDVFAETKSKDNILKPSKEQN